MSVAPAFPRAVRGEGEDRRRADVVVVGAGLAGLVAARDLARAGASVLVLEARDRVGGRVVNDPIGAGRVVETGGQWIGPTQDRMYALAADHGVGTFPTYATGENLLDLEGARSRYAGTIPRLAPAVLLDVLQAQKRLERLARRVPLEAPWRASRAVELDGQTLWTWLRRNVMSRRARKLIALAGRTVWGVQPQEMSLLHALFAIHSGGGLDALLDTEDGAQQDRVMGGTQVLALRLAQGLGERLLLRTPARRVEHGPGGVTVHAGGTVVDAGQAIIAIPPNLAGRIEYDPRLPHAREALTQRAAQGTLRKCVAVYPEPFWRRDGLTGEALTDAGPVTLTFDNSPPDGSPGVLLGFVGGPEERALARRSGPERREAVLRSFARLFGPGAARPERYLERAWGEERWSGGGPWCFLPPGAWTAYGHALREPAGPVHWAGTETAEVWCGYMEGAVRSGERAAREALEAAAGVRA
jgi:monoamine oxidase